MRTSLTTSKLPPIQTSRLVLFSMSLPDLRSLPCFALLDDAQSQEAQSRLYFDLHARILCEDAAHWTQSWSQAQDYLQQGFEVLALLQYETGAQLQTVPAAGTNELAPFVQQPTQLWVFRSHLVLNAEQVEQALQRAAEHNYAGLRGLHANVDQAQFTEAIQTIQRYIEAGDSYQVNYTYRLHFESYGSLFALYLGLRQRQPVPYAALILFPEGDAIVSLSPELFVRHQSGKILARPMKGTAPASGDHERDQATALALSQDEKNRAENLMIVDLLRNDLGRIAKTASVRVPALFQVQRFSSVLQMTSDIEAQLREHLNYAEIMTALFPCGSITGAPKRRTMEIIREVETTPRGIYTGSLGWFDPPRAEQTIGDFCLSVPIRTLYLQAPNAFGLRQGRMGVGAGIVHDSDAREEFKECQLKARFLTGYQPDFGLIETCYATREQGIRHLSRHLQRLQASAQVFEFRFELEALCERLQQTCTQLPPQQAHRVRIALFHDGRIDLQHAPLTALPERVKLILGDEVCTLDPLFRAHKTTHRHQYDQAWQSAEAQGAFDRVLFNSSGHVTEGGRSSIFIRQGEQWWTPPLSDGVLPGIMRSVFMEDARYRAQEKSLTARDLREADDIILTNALRGYLNADLM